MTPGEIQSWRLFVAIPVPLEVKSTIQRTQAAIRQRLPKEGIGWTRPEHFHLTLEFLGDVPVDSVTALTDALRAAAAKFRPLTLESRGLGFFPSPLGDDVRSRSSFPSHRVPRVLWAGITDLSGQLVELQQRVEQACAGFITRTEHAIAVVGDEVTSRSPLSAQVTEPAKSRFHAHVTLARVKRFQGRAGGDLPDAVSPCLEQEFGRWTANSIALIRSQLTSTGPTYTLLAELALSPSNL